MSKQMDWIPHIPRDAFDDTPPVDGEQRVEVKWGDGSTTKHRAGAFNWSIVKAYRLLPNPEHSR